jgi:hypothetical protein
VSTETGAMEPLHYTNAATRGTVHEGGYERCWCLDSEPVLQAEVVQLRTDLEAARATLRNVLAAIDQSEQYERQALQIRDVLGLCQTTGCDNKRLESREADGYCQECLDG